MSPDPRVRRATAEDADKADGLAQLRYRGQIYSDAPAAYLEELYVPDKPWGSRTGKGSQTAR
jgi:hypothetical protein